MAKSAAGDQASKSARKRTSTPQPSSSSPSKMPAPARPKATPKRRGPKKKDTDTKVNDADPSVADSEEVEEAAEAVANAVSEAVSRAAEPLPKNTARVTVNSDVQDDGKVETTRTSVKVEMPADAPSQPLPESPEKALETAKEIVLEAANMQEKGDGPSPAQKGGRKRKAVEALDLIEPEEEIVEVIAAADGAKGKKSEKPQFGERKGAPPAKRTRIMVPATDFRREKMQKRALMGLSASLAIGAIIPFVSGFF